MVAGVPGNPAVYYMGTAGSGIWKTVDGGQVWTCVSDSVRLTSVAAVAVAASRPDTVYAGAAGSGPEAGLYRSVDGGGHWELVALKGHAVSSIVIDPRRPETVMAAAADSGVVRTTDGGKNWKSVLPDSQAGGVWLVFDPDNPKNVYAGTRPIAENGRGGGGGRGAAPVRRPATDSQIYRSTDEGRHGRRPAPTDCRAATSARSRWRSRRGLAGSAFTITLRKACSGPMTRASIGRARRTIRG